MNELLKEHYDLLLDAENNLSKDYVNTSITYVIAAQRRMYEIVKKLIKHNQITGKDERWL